MVGTYTVDMFIVDLSKRIKEQMINQEDMLEGVGNLLLSEWIIWFDQELDLLYNGVVDGASEKELFDRLATVTLYGAKLILRTQIRGNS